MAIIFGMSFGLVVYTFIGYPAIMAVLARLRPRRYHRDPGYEPTISLIIAAYNEADVIESKLANTATLEYPRDRVEVIVVADGSDDDTAERARAVSGTTVLYEPERRGKLAAIARAANVAAGEVFVFSDANNMYSPETLRELVAPLADPSVGVVTGSKHILEGPTPEGDARALDRAEGLYWRYESTLKKWESTCGSVTAVAGEILAFRRSALYPTPAGMLTEDFVQAMIAATHGWRVVYTPAAVSTERASLTLSDETIRRARIVTGRWQAITRLLPIMIVRQPRLAWQVLSHKALRPIVPVALVIMAASSLSVAWTRRWARLFVATQGVFYGVAALGRRHDVRGEPLRWTYLPYYFCRMNLATLSGLAAFVRRQRNAAWTRVPRG